MHVLLFPALLAAASVDPVVARVDSQAITAREVAARADEVRAQGGTPDRRQILDTLVQQRLLSAEGYREGLAKDPEVVAGGERERRSLAADRFLDKELFSLATISDAQLLELFHAQADEVDHQLVVVASEQDAKALVERLQKGARLEEEAMRSLDPQSQAKKGAMGWRTRGSLQPALAQAAFSAPLDTWTGPVKLELGWAALRVVERRIGDEQEFARRKEGLRRFAQEQAKGQLKGHFLQQLRAQSGVKVDEKFLESTGNRVEPTPAEADHVVATVGDRKLLYGDVLAEMRRVFGAKAAGHMTGSRVKIDLSWAMVDRMVLEKTALERGFDKDPEVEARAREVERELVGRAYVARIQSSVPRPTDAEIESFYARNVADYTAPGSRRCAHILTGSKDMANQIRARLGRGEQFEELAKRFSVDEATGQNGGDIGEIADPALADMEKAPGTREIARAIKRTRAGQVSEPAKSDSGWHLFRCQAPTAPRPRPLAEVKDAVAARLIDQRGRERFEARLAELRGRARITVDEKALAASAPR